MRHARLIFNVLMVLLNIALVLVLAGLFFTRGYVDGAGFDAIQLVTIVLTAVAVLVTTLGIFVALLAIWGYNSLRSTSEEIAGETAESVVNSQLPALVRREVQDQLRTDRVIGAEKANEGAGFPASSLDKDEPR